MAKKTPKKRAPKTKAVSVAEVWAAVTALAARVEAVEMAVKPPRPPSA